MYFEVCVCYCSPHSARDDCFEMKLSVAPNKEELKVHSLTLKKTHDKNKTKQNKQSYHGIKRAA